MQTVRQLNAIGSASRSLEQLGLQMMESASITRPPRPVRSQLPASYRYLLRLADPLFGKAPRINLSRAASGPATAAG